jgi:hypothetical protein
MDFIELMFGDLLKDPEKEKREKERVKKNNRDRYHAKKLAKEMNIELTIERHTHDWICIVEYYKDTVGPKGWDDNLCCSCWKEVRDTLETIQEEQRCTAKH